MPKFLVFYFALLLSAFSSWAQTESLPFIRLAHLGTQGRPILDVFLTTKEPALNSDLGIDGRYKFQSVCLLSEADFAPLLRYAESYAAKNKAATKNTQYGTFEITLGPQASAHKFIYPRNKSLAFLAGALQVLRQQAPNADNGEAASRLETIMRRLNAGK